MDLSLEVIKLIDLKSLRYEIFFIGFLVIMVMTGCSEIDNFDSYEQIYPVKIGGEKLNFRLQIWGISGNHIRVILTKKEKSKNIHSFNEKEDFIFHGMLPLAFEVVSNDTLNIYSYVNPKGPEFFESDVEIMIHKLGKKDFEDVLKRNKNLTIIDYPSSEE